MSWSDFFDNITNPGFMAMKLDELLDITTEFAQDIIDLCENEGAEIVKATPAAIQEVSDILTPLWNPTPTTIMTAGYTLIQAFNETEQNQPEPRLLPPPATSND